MRWRRLRRSGRGEGVGWRSTSHAKTGFGKRESGALRMGQRPSVVAFRRHAVAVSILGARCHTHRPWWSRRIENDERQEGRPASSAGILETTIYAEHHSSSSSPSSFSSLGCCWRLYHVPELLEASCDPGGF